jgi:hypothetical protein
MSICPSIRASGAPSIYWRTLSGYPRAAHLTRRDAQVPPKPYQPERVEEVEKEKRRRTPSG